MGTPVVLSYGMGVDSTAILLRWLEEPASRDFDLKDLVVVTAMVGNEFGSTGRLVEKHVLPRMRAHGVRFVQVARLDARKTAGLFKLLDDSRCPEKLHFAGAFKLSDEMSAAGTVPQFRRNHRNCSITMKGVPLDAWIESEFKGNVFRHVMGFNAEEPERMARDTSYSTTERKSEYPLATWGWGRAKCEEYIASVVGEPWMKSCCVFCPFAAGKPGAMARYAAEPEAALEALKLEAVALALNPKMTLYSKKSMASCFVKAGNLAPLAELEQWKDAAPWALYRVRRVFSKPAKAVRNVEVLARGSRAAMESELASRGVIETEAGFGRVKLVRRGESYPAVEETLVSAPEVAKAKEGRGFVKAWAAVTGELEAAA